jgi:hypothetical protein
MSTGAQRTERRLDVRQVHEEIGYEDDHAAPADTRAVRLRLSDAGRETLRQAAGANTARRGCWSCGPGEIAVRI